MTVRRHDHVSLALRALTVGLALLGAVTKSLAYRRPDGDWQRAQPLLRDAWSSEQAEDVSGVGASEPAARRGRVPPPV